MIDQNFRRLRLKLANLITRAFVDRPGKRYQVSGVGENSRPDVQHMEPQGLHFRAPSGAEGLAVCPGGVPENVVLLNAQGTLPTATLAPGEGGLHFLGTFAVYLDADGKVHLGGGTSAADFVALAAKVDTALANIVTYINAHTHITTATVGAGPTPGVNSPPAPPLTSQASVAASKVKAT